MKNVLIVLGALLALATITLSFGSTDMDTLLGGDALLAMDELGNPEFVIFSKDVGQSRLAGQGPSIQNFTAYLQSLASKSNKTQFSMVPVMAILASLG